MRPSLNVLSDQLLEQILSEAKRILSQIGIEVRGPQLRQRLFDHGLGLDAAGERILFPPDVVDRAIATTPSTFTLYTRNGTSYTEIGGDRVHFTPGSSALRVLDHRNGEVRPANSTDFVEYIRLCDELEHIAYPSTAFSTNDDIEAQVSDAWRLYMALINTQKPIVSGAFTEHGVPRMIEMMELFRRDRADLIARPMSIFTITATGMFRYSEDSCQNLLDCVEAGIPVEIVPVTLMGLIAPVSLVGATVFHVVDTLAGLVMAQIVKPGAPVIFGGAPATFHMQAASSPMMAIEALHLDVAYVAVAKALNLPTQAYMAFSDGKFLDAQAGAETFGSALLAALAGVNSVSGPGMLDYLLVFSLEKLVYDNELCGQALHFTREMRPLDDLPAVDLARQVLAEGHLITADHTLQHWPQELYLTNPVTDRTNRENWVKEGERTLIDRAKQRVSERLAAYQPIETDPVIEAELRRLILSGLQRQEKLPELPIHEVQERHDERRRRAEQRAQRRLRRGSAFR